MGQGESREKLIEEELEVTGVQCAGAEVLGVKLSGIWRALE